MKNIEKMKFNFSPSEHHKHIMDNTEQALSFKGGDFDSWKSTLKAKLKSLLGKMPEEKCSLDVKTLWKQKNQFGNIEKIVYTSEPHCDVPAYVCIPDTPRIPSTLFICLQGHSSGMHNSIARDRDNEKKEITVEGDRDFAIGCMKRGIAALCIEQRSFGLRRERIQKSVSENMCHDAVMQAMMLGRTLIGERLYDIERGLDYLEERGDIDMKRIGIMGNSGGGTMSVYAAALLSRISHTMPSCSFGDFKSSKMSLYHCSCGYIPNLMLYAEMADVLGLFAPKPVVIVAGKYDPIVPFSSVREGFSQLKEIYKAAGAEEHCHLVVGNEGHRFYADKAWKVMLNEL